MARSGPLSEVALVNRHGESKPLLDLMVQARAEPAGLGRE